MPMTRILLLFGLMFFSGVAVFMGAAVSVNALSRGEISYSVGKGADTTVHTVKRDEDAATFWKRLGLIGGLPVVLGLAGLVWGRARLQRAS